MSTRMRHGQWRDHVIQADRILQGMNAATDEEARELASNPSYALQLTLASLVLSLNEAVVIGGAIIGWGMAMEPMAAKCDRPKDVRTRVLIALRTLMRHRGLLRGKGGDWEWNTVIAWARENGVNASTHEAVSAYETLVWAEVTGTGPGPG